MSEPETTRRKPHATEESMFKGWTLDRFLDRLPMFAVTVGRKFPDDVSDEVLQAWSDGIQDVADNVKDMIAEWRRVNGR